MNMFWDLVINPWRRAIELNLNSSVYESIGVKKEVQRGWAAGGGAWLGYRYVFLM